MIEIFRTNIRHKEAGKKVLTALREALPGVVATLELEHADKVLRVVGAWAPVLTSRVIEVVKNQGFECEYLHD